mgnify:CR=1 FL=1
MTIFKRACSISPPGIRKGADYQISKTRGNAYVKVSGGTLSLPIGDTTFDKTYVRSSGKPTVTLGTVSINIQGQDKFVRRATVNFTCYDRGTFLKFANGWLKPGLPDGGLTIKYGYVRPTDNSSSGTIDKLFVENFTYSTNEKNEYVCSLTAVGAGALMEEIDTMQHIKSTNLKIKQPNVEGDEEETIISSIVNLIDYDAQKAQGGSMIKDIDHGTKISKSGGTIMIYEEPVGGGWFARLLHKVTSFLGIDPNKMAYASLNYICKRMINDQLLTKITQGPFKGMKLKVENPAGFSIAGLTSGDPARCVIAGGTVGGRASDNYEHESNSDLGINFSGGASPTPKVISGGKLNVGNIMFSRDYIINALGAASTQIETQVEGTAGEKRTDSELSIKKFLGVLFDGVRDATGGWIQMGMMEDPDNPDLLLIHNRNHGGPGVEPTVFDPINGDGMTRGCNITCTPNQRDVYGAMILKLKERGQIPGELQGKSDPPKSPTAAQCITNLEGHMKTTAGTVGIGDELAVPMKAALIALKDAQSFGKIKNKVNITYPFKLQLKLDGVHGFKFGDLITSTTLPASVKDAANLCFRVHSWQHTINAGDWETSVEAIMDVR